MRAAELIRASSLVALSWLVLGCESPAAMRPTTPQTPRIGAVELAEPLLVGSVVRVSGISLDRLGREPVLEVMSGGKRFELRALPHDDRWSFLFEISDALVSELGNGFVDVELALEGNSIRTESRRATWELASELPLRIDGAPSGDVSRNEAWVLRGDGFISPTEGESHARFVGTFTRDIDGATSTLDTPLPITLLERTARDRAVMVLTTDLGGIWPGTFEGTMQIESELRNGFLRTSEALSVRMRFGEPQLFAVEPRMASVGQLLRVRGSGFLGGRDRPTEATLIRVEGMFTPRDGSPVPFGPMELVPRFESGSEVRLIIETETSEDEVVARLFGAARGTFAGQATPVVIAGSDEIAGPTVAFGFVLGPLTQVVHLRFLPGFYDSLDRFGLGSAANGEIEEAIARRIESIYADYSIQVRLDEPDDFDHTAFSVVEIGGPDPNGRGLFGYDNSPGKDVGNLRLFDHIGGANAETQADNYPGYGGVFIESLLWWSSHPDLPVARPASSPEPDPLFDELFDPVRLHPATFEEVNGVGDPARVAEVRRALDGLASIIGETTAHELGHSLGMAQPYGARTAFHNDIDGDGCLMDRGGDRPLGERTEQPGFARTTFCYDEPEYLTQILGL